MPAGHHVHAGSGRRGTRSSSVSPPAATPACCRCTGAPPAASCPGDAGPRGGAGRVGRGHRPWSSTRSDAGVGGRAAAVRIGRRLARLARTHQVIVVTHLPQVAAYADTHLVVEGAGDGSGPASEVRRLDDRATGGGRWRACWPGWGVRQRAGPRPGACWRGAGRLTCCWCD
jgi:hypothetical protein